MNFHCNNSIMP